MANVDGNWLVNHVAQDDTSKTSASTGTQTITYDLPTSHFISAIDGQITVNFSGGTNPSIRVDLERIKVIANSTQTLVNVEGDQLAAIHKVDQGRAPSDDGSTTSSPSQESFTVMAGRDRNDTDVIWPATGFSSLQLELQINANLTSGSLGSIDSIEIDIAVDQFVSPELKRRLQAGNANIRMRRINLVKTETGVSNDEELEFEPSLGAPMRRFYIHSENDQNVGGDLIEVEIDDGAETPVKILREQLREKNLNTYRFHDETIPQAGVARDETVWTIDFDVRENLRRLLPTADFDDLAIKTVAEASGAGNDLAVIKEEIVPV